MTLLFCLLLPSFFFGVEDRGGRQFPRDRLSPNKDRCVCVCTCVSRISSSRLLAIVVGIVDGVPLVHHVVDGGHKTVGILRGQEDIPFRGRRCPLEEDLCPTTTGRTANPPQGPPGPCPPVVRWCVISLVVDIRRPVDGIELKREDGRFQGDRPRRSDIHMTGEEGQIQPQNQEAGPPQDPDRRRMCIVLGHCVDILHTEQGDHPQDDERDQ